MTGAPYSAVKQAFRELVQLLLAEPDSALAEWKRRLVEALGNQGRVVTDLVPELERIIGPQAPTDPLGAADAQARFNLVFKRFLNVFTSTRGMTLFLDDWQWADSASLNFIYAITTDPDLKSLLVIGAYRDNEVDSSHRALQTLGKIAEAGTPASTIQLNPLSVAHLQSMLLNTLRCSPTHAAAVARAVHSRTGGNPFFVRSFLLTLHETGGSRSNTAPDGSAGRRRWTKV